MSETPTETKLCPFRKSDAIEFLEHDGKQSQSREHFAPCLQEKCAMWTEVGAYTGETREFPGGLKHLREMGCGLAGKP